MPTEVLDASALLAELLAETGGERVRAAIDRGAAMSTVNFAEVLNRLQKRGSDEAQLRRLHQGLRFPLTPFDDELAIQSALLRRVTMRKGLGLGDRACLALAKRLGVPALTSDRRWAEVADAVGVTVELIR